MKKAWIGAIGILIVAWILTPVFSEDNGVRAQQKVSAEKQRFTSRSKAFPKGTSTPSVECGECHQAIYREYTLGFGTDILCNPTAYLTPGQESRSLPARLLTAGSAHSVAGNDPRPGSAGNPCNVCHLPEPFEIPDLDKLEIEPPKAHPQARESIDISCAGCHLTLDGKIRGPYECEAPHQTVRESKMQTASMCAPCHLDGKQVPGKRVQTFLEWREDFHKPGLGSQQCRDCHMPGTLRKLVEDEDTPIRAVARHLWIDGRSRPRLAGSLSLVVEPEKESTSVLNFHVMNIGGGHSIPTGSNRRAVFLKAEIVDSKQTIVTSREWMFAPWYDNRPDDKSFLEEDKKRSDSAAAIQADSQGPHEKIIGAGEYRILSWDPKLKPGEYEVRASLIFDLNRYNGPNFQGDQTVLFTKAMQLKVQ